MRNKSRSCNENPRGWKRYVYVPFSYSKLLCNMSSERFYCEKAHVLRDISLATLLLCDYNAICHASLNMQEASVYCTPADDRSTWVKSRLLQISVRILLDWITHRLQTVPQVIEILLARGLLGFVSSGEVLLGEAVRLLHR